LRLEIALPGYSVWRGIDAELFDMISGFEALNESGFHMGV